MRPSVEFRDFMLRRDAFSTADALFLEAHVFALDGVLGIGTDPAEWYKGAEVQCMFKEQLQAAGTVPNEQLIGQELRA
jgi:hypothetical protein